MADAFRIAVGRIEPFRTRDQPRELMPEISQFGDSPVQLCGPGPEQLEHVAAGRLPLFAQSHDAADLPQRESDPLGSSNEGEAIECREVVVPVPGLQSRGRREETDVFVITDGLGRHPGSLSDRTDSQCLLTFLCAGTFTVPVMEVVLLYVPDCPHRSLARDHVDNALASIGLVAVVREQEIRTYEEAARLGMQGSPTILVDGRDPFSATADSPALACRLYCGEAGSMVVPSVEQLIEVLGG